MAETPTVRDIANVAEKMVVGLPQTVLSLLLRRSLVQDANEDADLSRHLSSIERSSTYIASEFEMEFEGVAVPLSDTLAQAVEALGASLRQTHEAVEGVIAEHSAEAALAVSTLVEAKLAPDIAAFLGALFTDVVAHERASAKLAQDVDAGALSQIDSLSRQIGFIAVNAAVEAARVGDAGRGFSVIAAEIKALSDKSRIAVEQMRKAVA